LYDKGTESVVKHNIAGKEIMEMEKTYRIIWSCSLLAISIITIFITVCNFAGVELSDVVKRILGIVDLCAVPVLIFVSVKLRILKNNNDENK
jgi:hypothetical protein